MSKQGISPSGSILPPPVWGHLSAECRAQAVRLMAQLAFKLLRAQFERSRKEEDDVKPIRRAQSAS